MIGILNITVLRIPLQSSDTDKFFNGRRNAALSINVMYSFHGDYTLRKWKREALRRPAKNLSLSVPCTVSIMEIKLFPLNKREQK